MSYSKTNLWFPLERWTYERCHSEVISTKTYILFPSTQYYLDTNVNLRKIRITNEKTTYNVVRSRITYATALHHNPIY
jgi:hypothetical protein